MNSPAVNKPFRRLLLTGAAGGLGRMLRPYLRELTDVLRVSDKADCGAAQAGEEVVIADLADRPAVHAMMRDVDAVLHFGGISLEAPFDELLQANFLGLYNLYEAVHRQGVRRVIYASSNHAIGYYRQSEVIDADRPLRPDSLYGVSKCFGEALSRYYFDRFGIECVCLRIGSSFPEPTNARMMVTWLSYADCAELVRCALLAPRVDHTIVFGMSDNPVKWWDNTRAAHLGFHPRDSSRPYADRFPPQVPDPSDPATLYQGGAWIYNAPIET
jgi:uronate dehydrogenase